MEEIEIMIDSIDSYESYGVKQSASSGGSPVVLRSHLEMFYRNELRKSTDISVKRQQKIDELSVKNADMKVQNENLEKNIDLYTNEINSIHEQIISIQNERDQLLKIKQDEINKKEVELEELKSGKKPSGVIVSYGDKLIYYIMLVTELCFTLYLWLFYVSVIYGAFMMSATKSVLENLKMNGIFSLTIFNPKALIEAWNGFGILGVSFLVTAPFLVFSLGLLIHKFQSEKKYWSAAIIYLITLFLDGLMAFAIVRNIYNANFNAGITLEPWNWKLAFQDIDFYIIILAGFVAYIIWGIILTYLIKGYDNIVPARVEIRRIQTEIKQLLNEKEKLALEFGDKISQKEKQIEEFKSKSENARIQMQSNLSAISANEEQIKTLKNIEKDIDIDALSSKVHQFLIGWCNQINLMNLPRKEDIINACNKEVELFLQKINQIHQV